MAVFAGKMDGILDDKKSTVKVYWKGIE